MSNGRRFGDSMRWVRTLDSKWSAPEVRGKAERSS
jgi:hypothetical protein